MSENFSRLPLPLPVLSLSLCGVGKRSLSLDQPRAPLPDPLKAHRKNGLRLVDGRGRLHIGKEVGLRRRRSAHSSPERAGNSGRGPLGPVRPREIPGTRRDGRHVAVSVKKISFPERWQGRGGMGEIVDCPPFFFAQPLSPSLSVSFSPPSHTQSLPPRSTKATGDLVAIKLIKRPLPKIILPNILREIRVRNFDEREREREMENWFLFFCSHALSLERAVFSFSKKARRSRPRSIPFFARRDRCKSSFWP